MKSSVDDTRRRFDADAERFSNLETGQSATVDAPLAMALVALAAAATTPHALDVGCGAGNHTLKLLEHLPAAVLHRLRTDADWREVFTAFRRALRPGGSVWVFDLVESAFPAIQNLMWKRYGEYLAALKDEADRDHVFACVEREDAPRPLTFQLDLLREVGFAQVEVLHKNVCFAVFGAVKGRPTKRQRSRTRPARMVAELAEGRGPRSVPIGLNPPPPGRRSAGRRAGGRRRF